MSVTLTFWNRNKQIMLYGIAMALLLFILKWLEWRLLIVYYTFEVYAGVIAVFFTALGIWLALKLAKPKTETIVVEKTIYVDQSAGFILNEAALNELNISRRELEVLQLMASGLSNQQIGERLFVSLNTIKTHAARLFEKLEVSRRTQAIEKAKRLHLIS
jgi:NarL family two-component system response regulator LiaR